MGKSAFFTKLIESGQFSMEDTGHAKLFGEYLLMIPPSVLLRLMADLEKSVGKVRMARIMSDLGEFQIDQALERYKIRFNIEGVDKRKIIDLEEHILNILGWGSFKVGSLSFEKGYASIIIVNNVLSLKYREMYGRKSKGPIDFYMAGLLKGMFSTLFEKKVKVREVRCIAKGDKYCEFAIS